MPILVVSVTPKEGQQQAIIDVHRTAPSLLKLRAETADLVSEPWDIKFLTPLPLGDETKGAL